LAESNEHETQSLHPFLFREAKTLYSENESSNYLQNVDIYLPIYIITLHTVAQQIFSTTRNPSPNQGMYKEVNIHTGE
jgi:hypothetical protein